MVKEWMRALDPTKPSKEIYKMANQVYHLLPINEMDFLSSCDVLLQESDQYMKFISIWVKKRALYDLSAFSYYRRWLEHNINDWALCDQFCYRILNPIVECHFFELSDQILDWCDSEKVFVNRAALVCLIHSGNEFEINVPMDFVAQVIDKVKSKKQPYITSAIGWVLKYAYVRDRDFVMNYVNQNAFSNLILNKIKEKMTQEDKRRIQK